jgi:Domain of unknown function (DUF4430)
LGSRLHRLALAAFAAALAGCGLGPGSTSEGTATLTVTRDYGTERMVEASVTDPDESETVLRMLDREAEIETRYGGGFVQSIDGVAGGTEGDRRRDWFFYVNGIESPVGSAERAVRGGDRIWWDNRDWSDAMRVPAVVGSWPEPFVQSSAEEERLPVRVECAGAPAPCETTAERLADEGVTVSEERLGRADQGEALRVLVGQWPEIEDDPAAAQIAEGPAASGVFAHFDGDELIALDVRADSASRLGDGAGLVAAVRQGERPPTWVVTGVDDSGVRAAAEALGDSVLRDRYAVVVGAGSDATLPVPVVEPP